jgi:hypothetical protein
MARQPRHADHGPIATNPIAADYFRRADRSAPHSTNEIQPSADAVIELLTEARLMPEPARALLGRADEDPHAAKVPLLRRLMKFVRDDDEAAYLARCREVAFLANTLVAGCSVQSRPFTPEEAFDAAAAVCNLGLECWTAAALPDAFLVDHDLVTAFEVGWAVLYRDVSRFVADRLISILDDLRVVDMDVRRELQALQRSLLGQRTAGKPWLARDAADVLMMLDITAWISVLGLLDECPIVPAALTALLEGRTGSVSPTAFDFISTTAQIGDIRVFMATLPGVLSR